MSKNESNSDLVRNSVEIGPTIAVASSALLALIFYLTSFLIPTTVLDKPLQFLSITSPFVAAFGLGLTVPRPRLRPMSYWLLGLIAGLMGFAQLFLVYYGFNCPPQHVPRHWIASLIVYTVSGMLLFASGASFGQRTKDVNRNSTPNVPNSGLAQWLMGLPDNSARLGALEKLITTLAALLGAVAALMKVVSG